jgi:hypothetical protein
LRAKGFLNTATDILFQRKLLLHISITKCSISTKNHLHGEENGTIWKLANGLALIINLLKDL